jgi:threonine/homoserine/homoserine lactone efflux protein
LPSTSNLLGFLVLAIVIIVVPGPSVLFAIGRALVLGTKLAVLSVLGNALGVGLQIVVVALGLGVLIQQVPGLLFIIKIAGALVIALLGVKAFLDRAKLGLDESESNSSSTVVRQSIFVGITNAKTFVFFVAALPSFVSTADGNPTIQMLFLGLIFSIIGIASDMVYAVAAGKAREWLSTSQQRLSNFRGAGGIALFCLGLYMFIDALELF